MKFYRCAVCGKMVAMVKETPVDTICCGKPMVELVPGEMDASQEKHVPVWTLADGLLTVKVGSAAHPMLPEHHIEWIAVETEAGNQRKVLPVDGKPEAVFALLPADRVKAVYAYCNLHGLWKSAE